MTQRPLPFGIEEIPERRRAPRPTWRHVAFAAIVGLGLLLILLPQARAAERTRPPLNLSADCPAHDLQRGDVLVMAIESSADGKPAVKSCSVIKRPPRYSPGEKRRNVKARVKT